MQSMGEAALVSSVFLDIRARMPFVPAIFRALASDPEALEAGWLQARTLYDHPLAATSAARLTASAAAPELAFRPSSALRRAAAPFRAELPLLLLIVTSLGLSLDGALELRARPEPNLPEPGPLPEQALPEYPGEHPLYEAIRAVYGTHHVPVMFRALAADGLLQEGWAGIGPYLASPQGRARVARVAEAAEDEARRFPEAAFLRSESTRATLEQFRIALPQNLVFAVAATPA